MKRFYEILFISFIFFIICFIYRGQQRITLNDGRGWDGLNYYSLAVQIQQGSKPIVGNLPFIRRLGTPYLVACYSSLTGDGIIESSLRINLLGSLVSVILLLIWLGNFIREFWVRAILCCLFMMTWFVLVRYTFYYPLTSDAWGAPWFLGSLLLLEPIRKSLNRDQDYKLSIYLICYSLINFLGVFFRESNAILCILPFFVLDSFKKREFSNLTKTGFLNICKRWVRLYYSRKTILFFIPFVFVMISQVIFPRYVVVNNPGEYSYFFTSLFWTFTKSLPEYLVGIFIAYGQLILLIPFFYKKYSHILQQRQELIFLLTLSLVLGLSGGSDTERILFMSGFPVVFLLTGISILNIFYSSQRWWLFVLLSLQTIAYRFFWTLPDVTTKKLHSPVPFFSLMGNHFSYLNLYSRFGDYKVNAILLLEYVLLFIATWFVLNKKISLKKGDVREVVKAS